MNNKKVNIEKLNVYYKQNKSSFHAVKNADLNIGPGEVVALIGESGSGKTTIAKAILGHLTFYADEVRIGDVFVPSNPNLINKKFRRKFATISQMIFQSPSASLNHHKRVWKVIAEGMYNIKLSKEESDAYVDYLQIFYKHKMLKFSEKINSKKLDKEIDKFNEIVEEIKKVNRKYLSYDKSKTFLLTYDELVKMDEYYNDKLEEIKNKVDALYNIKEYKTTVLENRIKRYYKSQFRTTESLLEVSEKDKKEYEILTNNYKDKIKKLNDEIIFIRKDFHVKKNKILSELKTTSKSLKSFKRLENNKKIKKLFNQAKKEIALIHNEKRNLLQEYNNSIKKIKGFDKLDSINDTYKKELVKVKKDKPKYNKEFKEQKNKLAMEYKKVLYEYTYKRKLLIKRLRVNQTIKKNREEKQLLKNQIDKLYSQIRKQDNYVFEVIKQEAKKKGLLDEYLVEEKKWENKLNNKIKYKRKPFGSNKDIKKRAFKLIEMVGLNKSIGYSFSSQLSGGQQQRVAIARAFSMEPEFIVADEPIASLDVSLQGAIINLIKDLAKKLKTSVLFISHDLEMTRRIANRTYVMYRGQIVEEGDTEAIFKNPIHPYTKMLISSSKTIDEALDGKEIRMYKSSDHVPGNETKKRKVSKNHFVLCNENELTKWKEEQ